MQDEYDSLDFSLENWILPDHICQPIARLERRWKHSGFYSFLRLMTYD